MKKILALLLCSIMIISFSCHVFADENGLDETASDEQYRVAEVPELRETNADTYLLSDGTYECVIYAEDKYYRDKTGELAEINNTIVPEELKRGTDTYNYANVSNSTRVYFSGTQPTVLITAGANELAFSLVGSNDVSIAVGAKGNSYDFKEFELQSDNCLTYADVFDGTDLVYSVNNGYLKEYLVLADASAPTIFQFKFDTKDCYIKENDEGTLDVYNSTGELSFEFGSLFAVDSAGNYTEDLKYEIIKVSEDTTTISISIDADYLNDPARVFPVLIDPSIMVTGDTCTYDTYVSSRYPTTNYYLYNWLRTGRDDDYYIRRTYIKFDLPSGISSDSITSAYINLKYYSGSTPSVKAYRATGSWSSSTLTWNNMPGYTTTNASGNSTLYSNNWYRLYVTNIVKSWRAGTYNNYGFVLKDTTESGTSQWTTFYSSDAASPNKPELHIVYTPKYSFQMISYVDQGYQQRFSNAVSNVQGHHAVVETILEQLFDLNVTYSVYTYTSCADDCKIATYGSVTNSNLTESCAHSNMHLTTAALRTELIADKGAGTAILSRYLWTGHIMPGNPASNSNSSNHTVIITPMAVVNSSTYQNLSDSTVQRESRFSLFHESSHQLGAHDHYCYGLSAGETHCSNSYCCSCNGETTPVCVMTSRKNIETTNIDSLYCDECTNIINSHLSNHH